MKKKNTSLAESGLDGETVCIARKMDARYVLMSTAHTTFCVKVSLMHL
jgi:hypothetical protein